MFQKKSAFTLIELLVVIVIIGILATIGVAQFNDYQEKARFAKAQAFASQAQKLLLAATTASEKSIVAHYAFDADSGTTIKDLSSYNHDLTLNPTYHSFSTETPSGSGQSWQTNDRAITLATSNSWSNQVTLMGWIYWDSDTGGALPISIFDDLTSTNIYITVDNRIEFGYRNESDVQVFSAANKFKPGKWHHVLGTIDGQTSRLYLDGELIVTRSASTTLEGQQGAVGIRLGYTPGSIGFAGKLDDVQIYDIALSNF